MQWGTGSTNLELSGGALHPCGVAIHSYPWMPGSLKCSACMWANRVRPGTTHNHGALLGRCPAILEDGLIMARFALQSFVDGYV